MIPLWEINAMAFVENKTHIEAKSFLVKTRRLFSSNEGQSLTPHTIGVQEIAKEGARD
jgi:hypothetical protein